MKIGLINPKPLLSPDVAIPQGLLSISAELKRNGYKCEIIDYCNPDVKESYSHLNKFDVIGLSVMTTQLHHAAAIAEKLDKHVKVVWGGIHCLLNPLSILNKFKNQFVISGEGEIPLVKLLDYFDGKETYESLINQKGVCLHNGQPIINKPYFIKQPDSLADIDFYDLPMLEKYIYKNLYYVYIHYFAIKV